MSFQILNADNQPIAIKVLDQEIAAFWKVEVHEKYYANPLGKLSDDDDIKLMSKKMSANWFDTIGYAIHSPQSNWTDGWDNVKNSLWIIQANGYYKYLLDLETMAEVIKYVSEYLRPYFEVIDHLTSKGYQPKQVIE